MKSAFSFECNIEQLALCGTVVFPQRIVFHSDINMLIKSVACQ